MALKPCPRCGGETRVMTKSPVGNAWEVYVCKKCAYSWRSTEGDKVILPQFMLTDEKIASMQMIPPIVPLKG